jgi:hypothetical protein
MGWTYHLGILVDRVPVCWVRFPRGRGMRRLLFLVFHVLERRGPVVWYSSFFGRRERDGWSGLWERDVPLAEHGRVEENAAVAAVRT